MHKNILGYEFNLKIKPDDQWFKESMAAQLIKVAIMQEDGLIHLNALSDLYFDFKEITKALPKRYPHRKIQSKKQNEVGLIKTNSLRRLYFSWLKSTAIRWTDIGKALKSIFKECVKASMVGTEGNKMTKEKFCDRKLL